MITRILQFRIEPYGLFLDLEGGGRVGVDPNTGDILLDEGHRPDGFHRAAIGPTVFKAFVLTPVSPETVELRLQYGENEHVIGVGPVLGAQAWVATASKLIERAAGAIETLETGKRTHRVVVVDDHTSIRDMLTFIIEREGNLEVVGQAGTGRAGLELIRRTKPEIAVIDLLLPEISGVELVRLAHSESPATKSIIYTGSTDTALLRSAMEAKPTALVSKEEPLGVLREALVAAIHGRIYTSPVTQTLSGIMEPPQNFDLGNLSERERAVLHLSWKGLSMDDIAFRLGLSRRTVQTYFQHLGRKVGVADTSQFKHLYERAGLILHLREPQEAYDRD